MKKALLIIVIFLLSAYLHSAEPLVRFYLQDGSSKQYNLSEIDNIKFPNAPETLQLQVFTNDSKTFYYPVQLIDTITFSIGQYSNQYVNLWHDGFKWDFAIHKIDSISIYYTPYTAVTIGTQHWMYRNLNVDHYRNGDSIAEVRDSIEWRNIQKGAWCYQANDPTNLAIYGKLYNWLAVNDSRDIAPFGWHVPTNNEYAILIYYLGDTAGGKLKETGTTHWLKPNTGATNESGFTALSGNYRIANGKFSGDGGIGCFWVADEWINSTRYMQLSFDQANASVNDILERFGFSVRCVKDF